MGTGGWDWLEVNADVSAWSGQHNVTIRWVTIDGTVGAVHFDNLRLGDNLLDDFETDPATNLNGWSYSENKQTGHGAWKRVRLTRWAKQWKAE